MKTIPSADRQSVFVEVGITALRDDDGSFLPAVPLFVQVPGTSENAPSQQSKDENLENITEILAAKFGEYIQGVQALEQIRNRKGA